MRPTRKFEFYMHLGCFQVGFKLDVEYGEYAIMLGLFTIEFNPKQSWSGY